MKNQDRMQNNFALNSRPQGKGQERINQSEKLFYVRPLHFNRIMSHTSAWIQGLCGAVLWFVASYVGSAQAQDDLWCHFPGSGEGVGKGKRIVLISGDEEYRSEESLPMLAKILATHYGFDCTVLFAINPKDGTIDPNNQENIPGMAALADADLAVIALRFRHLPDKDMEYFADFLDAGKPLVALRTSTHAFRYPADSDSAYAAYSYDNPKWLGGFGKQVLGETWVNHHGAHKQESTRGVIEAANQDHPILRGVKDVWGPTDVYGINGLPEGAAVLLRGEVLAGMDPQDPPVVGKKNEPMMPIAWARAYDNPSGKPSRIFCTTMGASQDFLSTGLRRLVVNACLWCLGEGEKISEQNNVKIVGDYQPTPFGFDGFTRGVHPHDLLSNNVN